jgi:hypothetical protein
VNDIDLNFCLCNIGYLGNQSDLVYYHGKNYLAAMEKFKVELDMPMERFENTFDFNEMAFGQRHIHMATPHHEDIIRKIMDEMAVQSYTAEAAA